MDEEEALILLRLVLYSDDRQAGHTHSFTQGILPCPNFLEHSFLVVAELFRFHAILIVVSQQPRGLLTTACRERMGKQFHILLTGE